MVVGDGRPGRDLVSNGHHGFGAAGMSVRAKPLDYVGQVASAISLFAVGRVAVLCHHNFYTFYNPGGWKAG